MADFSNIKQEININIADNNTQAITAEIMRTTLTDMIDAVDVNIPTLTSELTNDSNFAYISDIPTLTSELTNDSNFAVDANYVHTDNNFTTAYMTKLDAIEAGAEVNLIDSISVNSVQQQITNKNVDIFVPTLTSELTNDSNFAVDANYVHTDNNFTTAYMTKLDAIEAGAEVNVQANWDETDNTQDSYILNKPLIPTLTSQLTNDSDFAYLSDLTDINTHITEIEYVTSYALNELHTNKVEDPHYVHTDNNFTDANKQKLNSIPSGAQENTINSISVNNTVQPISVGKNVNITVPTANSELTNDSNFVSSTYVSYIVKLTQIEYDNLPTVDTTTLYLVN